MISFDTLEYYLEPIDHDDVSFVNICQFCESGS